MRWEFDFREPPHPNWPNAINVLDTDGRYIQGQASVTEKDGRYLVGIYVWSGDVADATRLQMERILDRKLTWLNYGGGNGHEGGTLC